MKKYQFPDIPEEEQAALVQSLLLLLEQFAERLQELEEENARLKDEINILKGEKKRPVFKGSKLEEKTASSAKTTAAPRKNRKRPGSKKKIKTAHLIIHQEKKVAPDEQVPKGSRFKGYQDFVVQDLHIQSLNTRYRLERWLTPDGKILTGKPPGGCHHFGPELRSYVLYQHYHCHTTQPLLLEQLSEWGVDISSGQINGLLTSNKDSFHAEKAHLLQEGLSSSFVTVDDSGARHQGKSGYVTHIGNDFFAWFGSTFSKSRINFLQLLRAGHEDYHLNSEAFSWMKKQKLPLFVITKLLNSPVRAFPDEASWQRLLKQLDITCQRHIGIATEGALSGSVLHHNRCDELAVISDDAGQFNVLIHGLCWVHAERLIHKLLPFNDKQRIEQATVRGQIWDYYKKLKACKMQPDVSRAKALEKEFDRIFTQRTSFATLNQALKRLYKNKRELLLVLLRPDVPLHTNGSERDIRDYVKKRKISAGTRSDEGKRCRDTFISLKKTCRKPGVSFWGYLIDRLTEGIQKVAYLPELVRESIASWGRAATGY